MLDNLPLHSALKPMPQGLMIA